MALSSSVVPYLALLSLLVSCIPGAYWFYKNMARFRRETGSHNQQLVREALHNIRQHSPYAILHDEYPPHSSGVLIHTVSDRSRQFPSTSRLFPSHPRPLPDPESQAQWVDVTHDSENMRGPVIFRTEQYWHLRSAWYRPSPERRLSQSLNHHRHS